MYRIKKYYILILTLLSAHFTNGQNQVDVLIIGGGAGGTSAGIQAARMGVKV